MWSFHGRRQVARFFRFLARRIKIDAWSAQAYVSQPDTVIVAGHARMSIRSTGRTVEFDWIHRWTMVGGKVTRFVGSSSPFSAPH